MKKDGAPVPAGGNQSGSVDSKTLASDGYKCSDPNGVDEMVLDEHPVLRKGTEMVDGITLEDDDDGVDHYPPKHIRSAVRARAAFRFLLGRG